MSRTEYSPQNPAIETSYHQNSIYSYLHRKSMDDSTALGVYCWHPEDILHEKSLTNLRLAALLEAGDEISPGQEAKITSIISEVISAHIIAEKWPHQVTLSNFFEDIGRTPLDPFCGRYGEDGYSAIKSNTGYDIKLEIPGGKPLTIDVTLEDLPRNFKRSVEHRTGVKILDFTRVVASLFSEFRAFVVEERRFTEDLVSLFNDFVYNTSFQNHRGLSRKERYYLLKQEILELLPFDKLKRTQTEVA